MGANKFGGASVDLPGVVANDALALVYRYAEGNIDTFFFTPEIFIISFITPFRSNYFVVRIIINTIKNENFRVWEFSYAVNAGFERKISKLS